MHAVLLGLAFAWWLQPLAASAQQSVGRAEAQAPLEGRWTGESSQQRKVSFDLKGGEIRSFTLDWEIVPPEPCAGSPERPVPVEKLNETAVMFFLENPVVRQGKFSFTYHGLAGMRSRTAAITGTIASDGSASGQFELLAPDCKARSKGTWTARRTEQK